MASRPAPPKRLGDLDAEIAQRAHFFDHFPGKARLLVDLRGDRPKFPIAEPSHRLAHGTMFFFQQHIHYRVQSCLITMVLMDAFAAIRIHRGRQ